MNLPATSLCFPRSDGVIPSLLYLKRFLSHESLSASSFPLRQE